MSWMRTGDPERDFLDWDHHMIQTEESYNRGNPVCVFCGERIDDEFCFVTNSYDEMDSCICEGCMMNRVIPKIRFAFKKHEEIADCIEAALGDLRDFTPHDEDREGGEYV